jgi:hypothetical protein
VTSTELFTHLAKLAGVTFVVSSVLAMGLSLFAYDVGAEKALAAAAQQGWTVVSVKDDFSRVF